jgi:type IV secretory pathway VirB4 component
MKFVYSLLCIAASSAVAHAADERIYRCGNEYTNTITEAQSKTCKLVSGANVTVIQAVKPPPPKAGASGQRSDTADQRAKEADARLILQTELQKAESKQAELLAEYNNGEPERIGSETRNNQKYLDRVASLKAAIARNDSDIAGIKRELARLSPSTSSAASSGK